MCYARVAVAVANERGSGLGPFAEPSGGPGLFARRPIQLAACLCWAARTTATGFDTSATPLAHGRVSACRTPLTIALSLARARALDP